LAAQARVLDALAHGPVPVPGVVAFEADAGWLGDAFLVMSYEDGHVGGEAPALDAWITDRPVARQRVLHEAFVDTLAAVHRFDWRAHGLGDTLRGGHGGATLAEEVAWWRDYVDWAADGTPTPGLADAITWCADTVPTRDRAPCSLCWGDARIGNVVFSDDERVHAVLDWELATVGPGESDVAWYLVLDELTTRFVGRAVPGFLRRDELLARYERQLGRELVDLPWHELFALTRSVAINERQARLAEAAGVPYPGVAGDANPVLRALTERITRFTSG
jgi:aminoglycoside phosphotransferase (APT) family kinase protein